MNYYQPRELLKDGKPTGLWHYTCRNDDRVWPVGYCAQDCPGHATPEEAREHYRQYLLDNARYDGYLRDEQRKCEICGAWTQRYAEGPHIFMHVLCDEHCNREGLSQVIGTMGDIISSY